MAVAVGKNKEILVVLSDTLSSRTFLVGGILDDLKAEFRAVRVEASFPIDRVFSADRLGTNVPRLDLYPIKGPLFRLLTYLDNLVDRHFGFFPLAVRHNAIHGLNEARMERGHKNPFLDYNLARPFPRSRALFRALYTFYTMRPRAISAKLVQSIRNRYRGVVISNIQMPNVQSFIHAARKAGVPVVGYVASWDHPVGKGVVLPFCVRYIVQNRFMHDALVGYHGIETSRISICGWPQMDSYVQPNDKGKFGKLLERYGLDVRKPVVLFAGNSSANFPNEPALVGEVVSRWRAESRHKNYSIIFRPHPRYLFHPEWEGLYENLRKLPDLFVQLPGYDDYEELVLIMKNMSCLVTNAGTILLDAIANDKPAVCLLYDILADDGIGDSVKNITGEHYRQLMESGAFYVARSTGELLDQVNTALADPRELGLERAHLREAVLGSMDGRAGRRVSEAIVECLGTGPEGVQ